MYSFIAAAADLAERGSWWPDSWFGRFWVLFGIAAQLAFTARFLIQWIASEKAGKSHVPIAFWYWSLVGGFMLFIYAVSWKHDVVLALGQGSGLIVYVRNLMLIYKEKRENAVKSADVDNTLTEEHVR